METHLIIIENFQRLDMQFELCRHCGEETIEVGKCKTCQKVFKFVCPECNIVYEEYHSDCTSTPILEKIVIE
jgi:transcription elongation factor Elf1